MHCSVEHWKKLDEKNWVAAAGWLLVLARGGDTEFRKVVVSMLEGARPAEQGALVMMGAQYPKELRVRRFLRSIAFGPYDGDLASASIYGLAAHLDHDENLRDKLLLQQLKWQSARARFSKPIEAISDVFFIWDTSEGKGTCRACSLIRT
jgi:hypothetical protein